MLPIYWWNIVSSTRNIMRDFWILRGSQNHLPPSQNTESDWSFFSCFTFHFLWDIYWNTYFGEHVFNNKPGPVFTYVCVHCESAPWFIYSVEKPKSQTKEITEGQPNNSILSIIQHIVLISLKFKYFSTDINNNLYHLFKPLNWACVEWIKDEVIINLSCGNLCTFLGSMVSFNSKPQIGRIFWIGDA